MSSANDMEKVFKDCSKMADNTSRVLVLKFLKTWLLFAKAHVLNFHLAKEQRKLLDEEYKEATRENFGVAVEDDDDVETVISSEVVSDGDGDNDNGQSEQIEEEDELLDEDESPVASSASAPAHSARRVKETPMEAILLMLAQNAILAQENAAKTNRLLEDMSADKVRKGSSSDSMAAATLKVAEDRLILANTKSFCASVGSQIDRDSILFLKFGSGKATDSKRDQEVFLLNIFNELVRSSASEDISVLATIALQKGMLC